MIQTDRNRHVAAFTLLALSLSLLPPIIHANEHVYVVSDEAPTLCEIGILFYGKCSAYRKIAKWNGISEPYRVRIGQKLVLKGSAIPTELGREKLLASWRRHFKLKGPAKVGSQLQKFKPAPVVSLSSNEPDAEIPVQVLVEKAEKRAAMSFDALVAEAKQTEVAMVQAAIAEVPAETPEKPAEPDPEVLKMRQILNTQAAFAEAREFFSQKNFDKALERTRAIRNQDGAFLPAWLLELAVQRALKNEDSARSVARELLGAHPSAAGLPVLRPYLSEGDSQ